jgi:hypothetical protein
MYARIICRHGLPKILPQIIGSFSNKIHNNPLILQYYAWSIFNHYVPVSDMDLN